MTSPVNSSDSTRLGRDAPSHHGGARRWTGAVENLSKKLSVNKLKWWASLVPIVFFVTWEYIWHYPAHEVIDKQPFLFMTIVAGTALIGSVLVLGQLHLLDRAQQLLREGNQELSARTAALEALFDLGTQLVALHEVTTVKETAAQRARQVLDADTAGLALLHEPSDTVQWELLVGHLGESRKSLSIPLGECVGGDVIQSGEPLIFENTAAETANVPGIRHLRAVEDLQAALVVPIRVGGKPIGAMLVGHRTSYSFDLKDMRLLLGLANQVAVAINNARLYERLAAYSALEERERLAREMHDGLAQLLGHVTARAGAALETLKRGQSDDSAQHLERLREVAEEAYVEVRQGILGLRIRPDEDVGLLQTLRTYLEHFGEQESIDVQFNTSIEELELDSAAHAVEVQAIRIVQEALTNVHRHAQAHRVRVTAEQQEGGLRIVVHDDGKGFDAERLKEHDDRFGLVSMRERAESVGGTFRVEATSGLGTSVHVWLPLNGVAR